MTKICIDPGHGGSDSGAVGIDKRYEKNDALKLSLALQHDLQQKGYEVIMTRMGDSYPSLSARVNKANSEKADLYISVHRNSAGSTATGIETLYRTITVKSSVNDANSKRLAEILQKKIVAVTGLRDRGAKVQNTNTYVLQKTTMPAVTVELGFVNNATDNEVFDSKYTEIAKAIADGVDEYYGKSSSSGNVTTPSTPSPAPGNTSSNVPAFYQNGGVAKKTSPMQRGDHIKWLQQKLIEKGFLAKGQDDGIFGPKTETAVKNFQQAAIDRGLDVGGPVKNGKQTPDGKAGKKTALALTVY